MAAYDAIVVGVGAVGAAATRHLAERGRDVLALEKYDVPNAMGSSHGVGRIIRLAYHEGADYLPMLERAYEDWRALDRRAERPLLTQTGSLTVGPPDGESVTGATATCRSHGIEHEELTGAAVNDRFPAYDLPTDYRALYQPDGGLLDPERCITTQVEAAHAAGATVRAREPVVGWENSGGRVTVRTPRSEYDADRLVIAAGPWAAEHVPALDRVLTLERHVACRFQPTDPASFSPDRFPVFVIDTADGRHFYGLPRHRRPGFKIGDANTDNAGIDPDTMDRHPSLGEAERARSFLEEFMPAGAGPVMQLSACVLTQTPDGDYIIDRVPEHPNVVVGAGLSGHGFKTSTVIGEALAALAVGDSPPIDLGAFGIDRFGTVV